MSTLVVCHRLWLRSQMSNATDFEIGNLTAFSIAKMKLGQLYVEWCLGRQLIF